jgi:hypothetical protein
MRRERFLVTGGKTHQAIRFQVLLMLVEDGEIVVEHVAKSHFAGSST